MARAIAGFNRDAVGDVEVVLAIEDEDRVGAKVVDNKEAAAGVKEGLVRICVRMSANKTWLVCIRTRRWGEEWAYEGCLGAP